MTTIMRSASGARTTMTEQPSHERTRTHTVLHDPLIDGGGATPSDAPLPPRAGRTSRHDDVPAAGNRRGRHPALSARILATGLATTGTLGLTAGYAFSAPSAPVPTPDSVTTGSPTGDPATGKQPGTPATGAQSNEEPGTAPQPAGSADGTQAPAPEQPAPPVVVLDVPPIAPATPGASAGSGWTPAPDPGNQQSSGSN